VLVGGWEPGTIDGPPEAILSRALEGLDRFVRDLAQGLPALSIELISSERRGDLIHLAARVRNGGLVPSGMGESETGVMRLELPEGAALLAGEARISFGHLAGGGVSATAEWLVRASEGAPLVLRAEDRAALPVAREVRP
jgi:hypothetical protein